MLQEERDLHRLLMKTHNLCLYILNNRYGYNSLEAERWKPKLELYAKAIRQGEYPYREVLRIRREINAVREKFVQQIISHIEK